MDWRDLESHVRELASCHWSAEAKPELINGVSFDCVIKKSSDYWVIIEVSKEETLEKLRQDIAKVSAVRPYLFGKHIYAECYFVCPRPSEKMRVTGEGDKIKVLSIEEIRGLLLGYHQYYIQRSKRPFGSAIDNQSGQPDTTEYIKVEYSTLDGKRTYTATDIADLLLRGEKVILIGEYGTGKSRCIQEVFFASHEKACSSWQFPIAIDLKENWGVRRGIELLRRHFDDLGISDVGESAIRLLGNKRLILLIDGFDELASQTWSNDPTTLKNIRRQSLSSISDLISRVNCGILLTGREHYFNSTDEMFSCFGLNPRGTTVLKCSNEFTEPQILEYLARIKGMTEIPEWLPKRPLICKILSSLEHDVLNDLIKNETGEMRFWIAAIRAICDREASINATLDANVILDVLIGLARLTREKPRDVGPISTREINDIFKAVTGVPPTDESAVILQRLPLLGRVEAQSSDRQFVDYYFLDGLRAEDVSREIFSQNDTITNMKWSNPLQPFGIRILSHEVSSSYDITGFIRFLRRSCSGGNSTLGGDLICALLCAHGGTFDFDGIILSESHIKSLDLTDSKISGLMISNSIIEELKITGATPQNFNINDCVIEKVDGVSEASGLPKWMTNNTVSEYVRVNTVTRIKQAKLSSEQKVFITIIKKTFFQPGSGRKEEALLRGFDSAELKRSSGKILKSLIREGILKTAPGKEGTLYIPQRSHAPRMSNIIKELSLSDDPLWTNLNPDN